MLERYQHVVESLADEAADALDTAWGVPTSTPTISRLAAVEQALTDAAQPLPIAQVHAHVRLLRPDADDSAKDIADACAALGRRGRAQPIERGVWQAVVAA